MKPKKYHTNRSLSLSPLLRLLSFPSYSALLKLLILFKNLFSSLLLNSRVYGRRKKAHETIFPGG